MGGDDTSYGGYGLKTLAAALTEDLLQSDLAYEQIRLTALATPADELGEGWAGYFISTRNNGQQVCATSKYAAPSAWEATEEPAQPSDIGKLGPEPVKSQPAQDQPAKSQPAEVQPARYYDEETGLYYDDVNWYLKDGATLWAAYPIASRGCPISTRKCWRPRGAELGTSLIR